MDGKETATAQKGGASNIEPKSTVQPSTGDLQNTLLKDTVNLPPPPSDLVDLTLPGFSGNKPTVSGDTVTVTTTTVVVPSITIDPVGQGDITVNRDSLFPNLSDNPDRVLNEFDNDELFETGNEGLEANGEKRVPPKINGGNARFTDPRFASTKRDSEDFRKGLPGTSQRSAMDEFNTLGQALRSSVGERQFNTWIGVTKEVLGLARNTRERMSSTRSDMEDDLLNLPDPKESRARIDEYVRRSALANKNLFEEFSKQTQLQTTYPPHFPPYGYPQTSYTFPGYPNPQSRIPHTHSNVTVPTTVHVGPVSSDREQQALNTPGTGANVATSLVDPRLSGIRPLTTVSEPDFFPYGRPVDSQVEPSSTVNTVPGITFGRTTVVSPSNGNSHQQTRSNTRSNQQIVSRNQLPVPQATSQRAPIPPNGGGGGGDDPNDPDGNGDPNGNGGFSGFHSGGGGGFPPNPPRNYGQTPYFPPSGYPPQPPYDPYNPFMFNIGQVPYMYPPNPNIAPQGGTPFMSRMFDPHKIKKYIGRKDHRSPVKFLREFEQCTGGITSDYIKGRLFLGTMDMDKFQMSNMYPADEGYQALKNRFLRTEWSGLCRKIILKEAEESEYNPNEWQSVADYLISTYSKLDDCKLNKNEIYSIMLSKIPLQYAGQLSFDHCKDPTTFSEKVRELDALFGQFWPIMNQRTQMGGKSHGSNGVYFIEQEEVLSDQEGQEEIEDQNSGNE